MDEVEKIKEDLYNNVFDNEVEIYEDRLKNDPEFTIKELRIHLDFQYNHQDDGWCGRGDVQHIEGQAKVAALEYVLNNEEKKEKKDS